MAWTLRDDSFPCFDGKEEENKIGIKNNTEETKNTHTATYSNFLSILRRSTELLNEDPIREEIFSVERLEQYAAYLAHEFVLSPNPRRGRSLLPNVKKCGHELLQAYLALAAAIGKKQAVSPAAEWFVDNFFIVEDQIREIKRDLPENYYYELPQLASGELKGLPRVYAMALAIIAHTDCRLDAETLKRFILAFQTETPVKIGELWAVAITLRIALLEQLLPLAVRIVDARKKRELADVLADQLLELALQPQTKSDDLVRRLSSELGPPEKFDRAFIVQLIQRLRDQDPDVWPALDWLEGQLMKVHATNTAQVIHLEHHRQAAAQVTVGNIITSMRLLSTLDWRDFFESVSMVDSILSQDPAGAFTKMDFATRDTYRHVIERIAKRSQKKVCELEVARVAVSLGAAVKDSNDGRRIHVGYYLIGEGLAQLEGLFKYRPCFRERPLRFIRRHPTLVYLGPLGILSALLLVPVYVYFVKMGGHFLAGVALCLLGMIPASELAIGIVHKFINFFIPPRPLPKMNLEAGVFEEARTMVVIPTLFSNEKVVHRLLEKLEIHFLANQDRYIYFALLGDFTDADRETLPEDETLLEIAKKGILELNRHYGNSPEDRFYLFHRSRHWNPSEGKWMGRERKRGKLQEFNRLLQGDRNTSFTTNTGNPDLLCKIKYVITLDSDTQLPRNSAHRLIGTIIHPLNRPQYCMNKKRITAGYGILQPRISVDLVSASQSRFASLFSGNIGLDIYTTAVSDVYQDLFGEGSFTGKGLYDVMAFEQALHNRVPENTVLSHDLFEGSYARSALVTDIEMFDDYPMDYNTFSQRQHRWTRGDWQILPWLFPRVPDAQGKLVPNNLSLVSRWKIFDNLRRNLVAPATLLWVILAWTLLPGSPFWWTVPILFLLCFPIFDPLITNAFLYRPNLPWKEHLRSAWIETQIKAKQVILMVSFLPSQAFVQIDAILRTLYRMGLSRKKLLEWVSFAEIQTQKEHWGPGPFLAVFVSLAMGVLRPESWFIGFPFLLLWILNPFLKQWLKERPSQSRRPLNEEEIKTLRRYSRSTWHYFETFVGKEDHYLAPDNFQEDPHPIIAHRTSPTNIGLQLLSTVSAYDFGHLGLMEFIESLERTFFSLGKLQKMQGHFFNWYDTQTLTPLRPQYISTVDSGNLAGHLLTLKQALLEISRLPFFNPQAREGLRDTLLLLMEKLNGVQYVFPNPSAISFKQMKDSLEKAIQSGERWGDGESEREPSLNLVYGHLILAEDILNSLIGEEGPERLAEVPVWMMAAIHQTKEFQRDLMESGAGEVVSRLERLASQCEEMVKEMNFRFLFDEERKIMVIGHNVAEGRHDNSYYELLASEARLSSFVAIAKGDIPEEHWFRLGRQMTSVHGNRALIAWTATMFEYLMPLLVMRSYEDTLLDQTYKSVVARQIEYGRQQNVPWGISEAGYNARDLNLNYQYGPFGIPGLGLKRGLGDDLVISPYSTMLALMVDPQAGLANLRLLEQMGVFSRYGFFESIDYTPDRLPKKQKSFILRSFMAHHQGMSLVALNNLLHENIMQRRFHSVPIVQATQLLLQERIPQRTEMARPRAEEVRSGASLSFSHNPLPKHYYDVDLPTPRTQLLSNGTYSVMISSTGSGYSRCGPLSINRWREDVTRDHWGYFFYIRNRQTGKFWSACFGPAETPAQNYEVTFAEDKVEFWREDNDIISHTEIIVSPEDNVELRRISLTNNSREACEFDVTSFMEVTLARASDDISHPAFSNLFIQTEFVPHVCALLATRRRRSPTENQVWGFHVVVTEGEAIGSVQYETNRKRFIGRGRSPSDPLAISEDRPLSNSVGAVLDPIFSLRRSVRIGPKETVRVAFATGLTSSREEALALADKYHDIHIFSRETDIAWTKSQVHLRHLNISTLTAHIFQRLAGRVLYSDPSLRPHSHLLESNTLVQANLWPYGISGDHPIILTRISDEKDMVMIRELLHGHEYLRLKGLTIDLVILNEHSSSYFQSLQEELQRQIRMSGSQALMDKPGGIFILRMDLLPKADVILLKTVARININAEKGTLDEQLKRRPLENELPPRFVPAFRKRHYPGIPFIVPPLKFWNGMGGFAKNGRHYLIVLRKDEWTPAPWINVIANDQDFGFLISESGSGYTWSVNSRENRLTTWSNDPVSDPVSEAIYIRDEDSGEYWTPTPLPIRETETYIVKHGQGYTTFDHITHGISQKLRMFVPLDASVKINRLVLKNLGKDFRNLSVTSFVEWVLGTERSVGAPHIITKIDGETGAIFARNPYNNEFAGRVAFAEMNGPKTSFTCDRKEFIGRNRSLSSPAAMERAFLSGRSGAGLDPCAAFQTHFKLAPGEEREIIILLGEAENEEKARELVLQYREKAKVSSAFDQMKAFWSETLRTVEIKTPDVAMNTLTNRWLLYQTISCRIWARSAFYQSGGAFGFRDQLQDVMSVVYSKPEMTRAQILAAAARQFPPGDVQHWWHPPTGRGVRTHFSDDLLWLPFVVSFYIKVTQDYSVLEEVVPFIEGRELGEGEDDVYMLPKTSQLKSTLFEHCARTLDRSLKVGPHGLPLMGSGDWNDGMNRVGHQGQGESVWVAQFLSLALKQFIPFCERAGEWDRAKIYGEHLIHLKNSLENNAWDGDWYLRAFFDNGAKLGHASNEECRIDSLTQSWAVLSGIGDPDRITRAMAAVNEHLIHRGDGLIKLFAPPFDKSDADPGYIKGYVPGVRENGGQYTHAAIWTMMAYAALGDGDRVGEIYSLLNPINHSSNHVGLHKYKVEPYVMAADIYGLFPHVGMGGWTWYTGSASWMYRATLESILGFHLSGDKLRITPCIPKHWREYEIIYRRKRSEYHILVINGEEQTANEKPQILLDGKKLSSSEIPILDDGANHTVIVRL